MTTVPCNTFLVRDVAELLGCSVPDVCTAFVQLGLGNRSTNMAITPDEALSVARHLALRPVQVPMTEDQVWHNDALMSANGIAGFKMDALMRIVRAVEAHRGITAQAKKD